MKKLILIALISSCAKNQLVKPSDRPNFICRQGVFQIDKGGYYAPHLGENGSYTACKE